MIKMKVLPKCNFIFLHVPLAISNKLLSSIQRIIIRFIWCKKTPRIRAKVMQQKIQEGRVGLPNIGEYYEAAQLEELWKWWALQSSSMNSWWTEQAMTDIPLLEWIWLEKEKRSNLKKGQSSDVLAKNWDLVKDKIVPRISPISSIYYHPSFEIIKRDSNFEVWRKVAFWRYMDCMRDWEIKPLHELARKIPITRLN